MTKRDHGFEFPEKLGQRLRELRERAGLTQSEVSELMGRKGANSRGQVSQLELGRVPGPTLSLLADFLRAVRGKFSEIADILDEYTTRPTAVEAEGTKRIEEVAKRLPAEVARKVRKYDVALRVRKRVAREKPEPVDRRVLHARRLAAKWLQMQKVEETMHALLNREGVRQLTGRRKALADHGRKVWGILNRTRKKGRERREKLLAEKRDWLVAQDVEERLVRLVEQAVANLHAKMELEGELDRMPADTVALKMKGRGRKHYVETDEQMSRRKHEEKLFAWNAARHEFIQATRTKVSSLLGKAGIPSTPQAKYLSSVTSYFNAASSGEPGERNRERTLALVEKDYVKAGCDAKVMRAIRKLVLAEYDKVRDSMPANPHG